MSNYEFAARQSGLAGTWLEWGMAGLAGVLGGVLFFLTPGGVTVSLLLVGVTVLLVRQDQDRRFLLLLVCSAYALRVLVIAGRDFGLTAAGLAYTLYGIPSFTYEGDHGYYTVRSLWLQEILLGHPVTVLQWGEVVTKYGRSAHLFVLAGYYFLFGYSPVSATCIPAALGSLSALFAHRVARELFSMSGGRAASLMVAFAPPLFAWSVTNLKESYLFFSVLLILHLFLRWMDGGSIWVLAPIPLLIMFMEGTRIYSGLIMLGTLGFAIVFITPRPWFRVVNVSATLSAVGAAIYLFGPMPTHVARIGLYRVARFTLGQSHTGGFSYYLLPEKYYGSEASDALLSGLRWVDFGMLFTKGWIYFLFAPFPWATASINQLVVYPWMLSWYVLLALALIGLLLALTSRPKPTMVLVSYVLFMGTAIAVTGGNVGTLFRHRDVVSPIVFIFSGVGVAGLLRSLATGAACPRPRMSNDHP